MSSVAVCIPTYRRPEGLAALLTSLCKSGLGDARVVVVDNDPGRSAEPIVRPYTDLLPGLLYATEAEPGISAARNRLVALARSLGVDWIAFLDDDQVVTPGWLGAVIATATAYNAAAVAGPVVARYSDAIPRWVVAGGFFERPRYPTGTRVRASGLGNVALRLDALAGFETPFEPRFGLTGGEDSHLLEQLRRRAVDVVWCDEAVVHEPVAPARATALWLLRRGLRSGATYSVSLKLLDPHPRRRAVRALVCAARFGQGAALLPLALVRGRAGVLRALVRCSTALGGLVGLLGFGYAEYGRVS